MTKFFVLCCLFLTCISQAQTNKELIAELNARGVGLTEQEQQLFLNRMSSTTVSNVTPPKIQKVKVEPTDIERAIELYFELHNTEIVKRGSYEVEANGLITSKVILDLLVDIIPFVIDALRQDTPYPLNVFKWTNKAKALYRADPTIRHKFDN